MPKVALYNIEGKQIGDIDLKDEIFAPSPKSHLLLILLFVCPF